MDIVDVAFTSKSCSPMKETINVAPMGASSVKCPSVSEMVLFDVPFCWIVAPTNGSPEPSLTVPVTLFIGACDIFWGDKTIYF